MIRPASLRNPAVLGSMAALAAAFCYGAGALVARKVVIDFAPPWPRPRKQQDYNTLANTPLLRTRQRHTPGP